MWEIITVLKGWNPRVIFQIFLQFRSVYPFQKNKDIYVIFALGKKVKKNALVQKQDTFSVSTLANHVSFVFPERIAEWEKNPPQTISQQKQSSS